MGLQRRQLATEASLERLSAQLSNLEWRNCKDTDDIMGRIQAIEKRQAAFQERSQDWQTQQEARMEKQTLLMRQVLDAATNTAPTPTLIRRGTTGESRGTAET